MIQIDLENYDFFLDTYWEEIEKSLKNIEKKREFLGFLNVDKQKWLQEIEDFAWEKKKHFKNLIVLWVGGSALGTKAILQAIKWKYHNENIGKKWLNVYVLDNVDPTEIENILQVIKLEETLVCFISKSATTLETRSQFLFFKNLYIKSWYKEKLQHHFFFIVWEDAKILWEVRKQW
jgi:glucose-6-phosphate isomerase